MKKLLADLRRLYKRAALIGALVAITCHVIPQQYRTACDALAQLCMVDR